MTSEFQFDAFISYNRNDIAFADELEKALERYTIPKGVQPGRKHMKVFRDTDDMTGTDYVKAIRRHLDASRKLIVICSPNARTSEFVNDEIRHFLEGRSPESVIPVLFRGIANNEKGDESDHAFPPALVEAMGMPLGVNYRDWQKGSPKAKHFRNAWFSMLADLFDVSRDEMEERDRRRKAARNRAWGGIALAVLVTTGFLAANWWTERNVREATELISDTQGYLQVAVNTRNVQSRARVLSEMAGMPEVDGVLESALSTGMSVSRWWFADLPSDYAINTWDARIESTPNNQIRPLAAAAHLDRDCDFSLPQSEVVEGLRSPDGSLDIYIHEKALFIQNADGIGPAKVTCLRTGGWDSSSGTEWWREGTETLTGRVAFGAYRNLPVAMVKDRGSLSLNVVRSFRPGKHLMALGNVNEARFVDNESIEIQVNGLPSQTVRLPAAGEESPAVSDRCFNYDGDPLTIGEIFELNGMSGYQANEQHQYEKLKACKLDNGRILAYVTSTYGEFSSVGIVAALDVQTHEALFQNYNYSEDCTAFGRNSMSFCTPGDLTSERITGEVGFWHFGENDSIHVLEVEQWPQIMHGNALASPNGGIIALWGSAWEEFPADRPVVVWLEDREQLRPFLLEEFPSPVAQVEFSPDSRFLMIRRENGNLRLYSFHTRTLLQELGTRVALVRADSEE